MFRTLTQPLNYLNVWHNYAKLGKLCVKYFKILIFDEKTNVKKVEVVKKSEKVGEVQKSQVTDVEQVEP